MLKTDLQYFGGRGASSGISERRNQYGSQYHTIHEAGNIKFVEANSRRSEPLFESRTKGRVYVRIGGGELKQIIYFDTEEKRKKTIDLDHRHKGLSEHVHHGYYHDEYEQSKKKATKPDTKETKMIERVTRIWNNYLRRSNSNGASRGAHTSG